MSFDSHLVEFLNITCFIDKLTYAYQNIDLISPITKVAIFRNNFKYKMISKKRRLFITILFITFFSYHSIGQTIDSTSFSLNSRLSFYSDEKKGEMLLHIPPKLRNSNLQITLRNNGQIISEWKGLLREDIQRLAFDINDSVSSGTVEAEISRVGMSNLKYRCRANLVILQHKPNEVKIDRLTGGLIVNQLPFFPFGFYTYSPVHPTLPEEEVVKGFNLISPYQRIMPETMYQRKAYMDRCAELGMKVNYNLTSVAGGGGVNSKNEGMDNEKRNQLLINEVRTFMDHPALLAWYIADEPDGNRVSPETLEEIYKVIKETDPWHPVTIVFMTPFTKAKDYVNAMDIVMADPYPIPVYPPTMAGNAARRLKNEFNGRMPVWIVPQAFGGGEHWLREPTIQEVRTMTWQAIIEGATGIQYFIRQGLNAFPKSTAMWNECGKMAMEVNAIVPWLLTEEKNIPVTSLSNDISVTSKYCRGQLLILAVNKTNSPHPVQLTINKNISGRAKVLFENRTVPLTAGIIHDYIQSYGTLAYIIDIERPTEIIKPFKNNMLADPGFENISSPGIPSACYARPGNDRGATYFTDPRVAFEGNYSLRLVTPKENSGVTLTFYPVKVKPGNSYMISVWAKCDPEQRLTDSVSNSLGKNPMPQYVEMGLGNFHRARFIPESEWRQFVTFATIPEDTVPEIKTNVILKMPGQGVGWFDLIQIIEDPMKDKK